MWPAASGISNKEMKKFDLSVKISVLTLLGLWLGWNALHLFILTLFGIMDSKPIYWAYATSILALYCAYICSGFVLTFWKTVWVGMILIVSSQIHMWRL